MEKIKEAVDAIKAQQKGLKKGSPAWCVGEQLKDMCRSIPGAAELVAQDMTVKEMGIVEAEKKIRAAADDYHKKNGGSIGFVSPMEADRILREFYGIHGEAAPVQEKEEREAVKASEPVEEAGDGASGVIDLDAFF